MVELYGDLQQVFSDVRDGKLDYRIGNTLATLASAMVKTMQTGELEARMRALEERRQAS